MGDQGKLIDIFNRDVWAPYRRDVAEGNAEWQKKFSVDVGCHTALAWRNDVPLPDSEGNEFFAEYEFYRWAKDEADAESAAKYKAYKFELTLIKKHVIKKETWLVFRQLILDAAPNDLHNNFNTTVE